LSTGTRPLVHKTLRDSRNIPGAIMAEIWMRIRGRLVDGPIVPADLEDDPGPSWARDLRLQESGQRINWRL